MILIYTHKITPRVLYIFKHIFSRILLITAEFTSEKEKFLTYNGLKLVYSKTPLGRGLFIKSNDLLFEQGLNDLEIIVQNWDSVPCFFKAGMESSIPYDIFAASFYLLSRYEEYLPHVKDKHDRYSADQSLAFKYGFLERPVIDIWAYKLLSVLKEKFPDYNYKNRTYKFISTIDIDNAYAFKHKSIVRSIGGVIIDLIKFRPLNLIKRFATIFNIKEDPFNTFQKILSIKKEQNIKTIFFFLVGDNTTFDTNISASNTKYKLLIKEMVDYAKVGLHPSYFTMNKVSMLKKEKIRLENIINMPVKRSRQHYLRFSLPETYQNLIDLEIKEDYSMGYSKTVGFRAGTCTPFYFYDLDFEIQTPLKLFPFALMDTTLNDYMKLTPKQSFGKIRDLKKEVEAVDGTFITLFHNESLGGHPRKWKGWKHLYESTIKIATL